MESPVDIRIKDGGLGRGGSGADGLHVKIGVAEGGDANKLYLISNDKEVPFVLGGGMLSDTLTRHFDEKGNRCFGIRPVNDVNGSIGSITKSGNGAVLSATGQPLATKDYVVEIISGGASESATFRFSGDGGIKWSGVFVTPAVSSEIDLGNGVKISFGSGDLVTGERYSFSSVGPTASVTEFLKTIDEVRKLYNPKLAPYRFIHIVGGFDRSFWEAVKSKIQDFEDNRIFIHFILEYPKALDGADITEYFRLMKEEAKLFESKRIAVVGSRQRYGSDSEFRSTAIMLCANLSNEKTNTHPGWVERFKSISSSEIEHWNVINESGEYLDLANIIFARHYSNWDGIFIHQDNLMSDETSDFQKIHEIRPADKVRFLAYNKIMPFINAAVEGGSGGLNSLIAEIDVEIETKMEQAGRAEIAGHETELVFDEDTNEVTGSVAIYKIGTMEKITIDIGYQKKG